MNQSKPYETASTDRLYRSRNRDLASLAEESQIAFGRFPYEREFLGLEDSPRLQEPTRSAQASPAENHWLGLLENGRRRIEHRVENRR